MKRPHCMAGSEVFLFSHRGQGRLFDGQGDSLLFTQEIRAPAFHSPAPCPSQARSEVQCPHRVAFTGIVERQ